MDNGPVNLSHKTLQLLMQRAIHLRTTTPHCSEQNPAERYIRTICTVCRILLAASGRPMAYWGMAMLHAVYLHNRLPKKMNPGYKSPEHMETSIAPDLRHLHPWGDTVYCHLPHDDREMARPESLSAAAEVGVYVGCTSGTHKHLVFFPHRGRNGGGNVLERRHLLFYKPGTAPPDMEGDAKFRNRVEHDAHDRRQQR